MTDTETPPLPAFPAAPMTPKRELASPPPLGELTAPEPVSGLGFEGLCCWTERWPMARRAAFRTEDIGLLRCGCRRPIAKVFPCKKGERRSGQYEGAMPKDESHRHIFRFRV